MAEKSWVERSLESDRVVKRRRNQRVLGEILLGFSLLGGILALVLDSDMIMGFTIVVAIVGQSVYSASYGDPRIKPDPGV